MRKLTIAVVTITVVALGACKKDPAKAVDPTAPAAKAFPAPPFLAHVPADTPYVFASLEAVPRSYWTKLGAAFGPETDALLERALAEPATTPVEKFGQALIRELRGNLNEAGLKKLFGVDAGSRLVIYGNGIFPVVRLELADPAALPATVERLAKEAGLELPKATHEGRTYYRGGDADVAVLGAVADAQLVVAVVPARLADRALPHVLGLEKPAQNMTSGPLHQVIAANGYGPHAGYIDLRRVVDALAAESYFVPESPPPATCTPALAAEARRFPRLSFGYHEWNEKRIAGKMLLEMDPAVAARLASLVTEVPGLPNGPFPDRPLFAMGAGLVLDAGRKLAIDFLGSIGKLATACGSPDAERDLQQTAAALGQPLPPALAGARGVVVSVLDAAMTQGTPSADGYAILAAAEPGKLLDEIQKIAPLPGLAAMPRDGKFHEVAPADMTGGFGAVRAAMKPNAVVAVVGGERATRGAESALAAPTGSSPLFAFAYDYGRFMTLILSAMPAGAEPPEMAIVKRIAGMLGVVSMWATPSDKGLLFGMSMELN